MPGARIGEKHTAEDWGLIMTDYQTGIPEVQTKYVEIPGRNGLLDLSESLGGRVSYGNRQISMTFILPEKNIAKWKDTERQIRAYCHGKKMKIVFDYDSEYYYQGRCEVEVQREDQMHGTVSISVNAEPYRYKKDRTEVLQELQGKEVQLVLSCSSMPAVPEITNTESVALVYGDYRVALNPGTHTIGNWVLSEGDNYCQLNGTGTVVIRYQEGDL